MRTTVTARNFDLSDALRGQIERKLQRLERIAHADAPAEVELIAKAPRAAESANTAEVTLVSNGSVMRSVGTGPTMVAALDGLIDKLTRQMVRARERPRRGRERHSDEGREARAGGGKGGRSRRAGGGAAERGLDGRRGRYRPSVGRISSAATIAISATKKTARATASRSRVAACPG